MLAKFAADKMRSQVYPCLGYAVSTRVLRWYFLRALKIPISRVFSVVTAPTPRNFSIALCFRRYCCCVMWIERSGTRTRLSRIVILVHRLFSQKNFIGNFTVNVTTVSAQLFLFVRVYLVKKNALWMTSSQSQQKAA